MTSSQESRNRSSLGNCCFSSGDEFSSTKNKQIEVGKTMRSSSKQNKSIKLWDIPEVTLLGFKTFLDVTEVMKT